MKRLRTTITVLVTIGVFACLAVIPSSCISEKSRLERKVDAFLKVGDYERALKLVEGYVQRYPEKPIGRAMLARVLAADGQTDSAFTEYH